MRYAPYFMMLGFVAFTAVGVKAANAQNRHQAPPYQFSSFAKSSFTFEYENREFFVTPTLDLEFSGRAESYVESSKERVESNAILFDPQFQLSFARLATNAPAKGGVGVETSLRDRQGNSFDLLLTPQRSSIPIEVRSETVNDSRINLNTGFEFTYRLPSSGKGKGFKPKNIFDGAPISVGANFQLEAKNLFQPTYNVNKASIYVRSPLGRLEFGRGVSLPFEPERHEVNYGGAFDTARFGDYTLQYVTPNIQGFTAGIKYDTKNKSYAGSATFTRRFKNNLFTAAAYADSLKSYQGAVGYKRFINPKLSAAITLRAGVDNDNERFYGAILDGQYKNTTLSLSAYRVESNQIRLFYPTRLRGSYTLTAFDQQRFNRENVYEVQVAHFLNKRTKLFGGFKYTDHRLLGSLKHFYGGLTVTF